MRCLIITILLFSCTEDVCDCDYVTYTDGKESYRSTWDASCDNEVLDESVYTYSDGTKTYTTTVIECQ